MPEKKMLLHLAAFIYTGAATQVWRHPDINYHQSLDVDYFIKYAQLAEKTKFDTLFLADGASNIINDVTKRFWSVSSFEPVTLFSAIAARTERIGLVYTSSVSDNEPTLVARQLASLDHISHGRAGWNVVTTPGPGSQNLHVPKEEGKDSVAKYRRAQLFVDVVKRLWDSFEDDALLRDKGSGIYVDVEKVHTPNIDNGLYKAELPLKVERPIQGWPVIAQAGTSAEGMAFGGANADLVYCANYSIEEGQKTFRSYKTHTVAAGRKPEELVILTGVAVIWGETLEEAERKLKEVTDLWPIEVAVHNLGMGFEIEKVDLDAPFPQDYDQIGGSNGGLKSSGREAAIASFAKANNLTLRQAAERCSVGLGYRPLVGTTQSIADDLQAWLEAETTDGFAVIQPLVIDGLRDFSEHVIPELVRRGLFRSEYEGKTLRENLGLARPKNYYTLLRNGTA
jgi:FMN-dependent oxidoreductase (nitrilotriacetate monooxygenase family)